MPWEWIRAMPGAMISGIGIDVARIDEFDRLLKDPATHFLAVHFTPGELAYARAQAHGDAARHLAARYAAKEAMVKAVRGSGFEVRGSKSGRGEQRTPNIEHRTIDYREIEVMTMADGAPTLRFHGDVAVATDRAGVQRAHLSLSHEADFAVAMVILES